MAEQVSNPEEIEERLADEPVPAGSEEENSSDLAFGVSQAMAAHLKALVDIAYDLEMQFGKPWDP